MSSSKDENNGRDFKIFISHFHVFSFCVFLILVDSLRQIYEIKLYYLISGRKAKKKSEK